MRSETRLALGERRWGRVAGLACGTERSSMGVLQEIVDLGMELFISAHKDQIDWAAVQAARQPPSPAGFVYLMHNPSSGAYKIGFSGNPTARRSKLSLDSGGRIDLICQIPTNDMRLLEATLHDRFASKRRHGEWFDLDKIDVEQILQLSRCES